MRERYIKFPAAIVEFEEVSFTSLYINPFSIDAYFESSIECPDEEGNVHDIQAVRVITRNGNEFDILVPLEDFETAIFR